MKNCTTAVGLGAINFGANGSSYWSCRWSITLQAGTYLRSPLPGRKRNSENPKTKGKLLISICVAHFEVCFGCHWQSRLHLGLEACAHIHSLMGSFSHLQFVYSSKKCSKWLLHALGVQDTYSFSPCFELKLRRDWKINQMNWITVSHQLWGDLVYLLTFRFLGDKFRSVIRVTGGIGQRAQLGICCLYKHKDWIWFPHPHSNWMLWYLPQRFHSAIEKAQPGSSQRSERVPELPHTMEDPEDREEKDRHATM